MRVVKGEEGEVSVGREEGEKVSVGGRWIIGEVMCMGQEEA